MSGASSSNVGGTTYDTSLSDAYAKAGASASQVQAIRNQEIAHQSGGGSSVNSASGSSLYFIISGSSMFLCNYIPA